MYPMFSSLVFFCASCASPVIDAACCFSVYPVLAENVESVVVIHDSALENNISILLIAHLPLYIHMRARRTRLLMQAYRFSVYPVLVGVEHAKYNVATHDSAMENNIPILLRTHPPICMLYNIEATQLST
jgi:hypothetical protein